MPDEQYGIKCSGCSWRFAGTANEIQRMAALHDDSPQARHIVLVDPPGIWPFPEKDQ